MSRIDITLGRIQSLHTDFVMSYGRRRGEWSTPLYIAVHNSNLILFLLFLETNRRHREEERG